MSDGNLLADPLVTKEGIRVTVGQRWRDLDKRMDGRIREVIEVDPKRGKVRMVHPNAPHFSSWVSVRRMHKNSTGWELVK